MNDIETAIETPRWSVLQRIGFRFLFVYLILYIATFFGVLRFLLSINGSWWESFVKWVGQTIFGVTITITTSGSGDTTYNYVELFCLVTITLVATVIWSIMDRRCPAYPRLQEALRVIVRHFLALVLILYGSAKIVPLQFGTVTPYTLTTPIGERSPQGLLWSFMAASPVYASFTGAVEFIAGILLIFRHTTLLGALIGAGALTHVVMLNFCYDVPVKLFSTHLLAMSLFLIAPDTRRLWNFFVMGRPVSPALVLPRFQRPSLNRLVVGGKHSVFLLLAAAILIGCAVFVYKLGRFSPAKPLHGVWDVVEFERNGQVVPPLTTEAARWKQFLIVRLGNMVLVAIRPMTGDADRRDAELAENARSLTIKEDQESKKPEVVFTYEQPAPDVLVLTGTIDGESIRAKLQRVPLEQFYLITHGFHWINETPFNR